VGGSLGRLARGACGAEAVPLAGPGRAETRETAGLFIDGLLSSAERKTGWMLAEAAGLERLYRIQALLGRSSWSADPLRDLVRAYVAQALGDEGGVLVIDDTGFLTRGSIRSGWHGSIRGRPGGSRTVRSACSRPMPTTGGRRSWTVASICQRTGPMTRRGRAGVPAEAAFAKKPALAREMIARTLEAGLPCAWVLADAARGSDHQLRRLLEASGQPYVLAVRSNHALRFLQNWTLIETDPAAKAGELEADQWASLAPEGAKGPRLYDWAWMRLGGESADGFERWPLVRCSQRDPEALATFSPAPPKAPAWPNSPAPPAYAGRSRSASCSPRTISASTPARRAPGTAGTAT
jgi:hypothetical protein